MNLKKSSVNRRRFLRAGTLAATAVAAAPAGLLAQDVGIDQWHGLKMGVASYTYRKFTLDQAIDMTKQAGVKHVCLKDMHLPIKTTKDERQAAHKKITDNRLILMGCGVIYMDNNEEQIRGFFEYARDASIPLIVCSPDPAAMDLVEKMVKEFNIRIAIHNHGPGDKRYPSPLDVLNMVKDRDSRMGICMDVGHTVRIGEDPVQVIKQCAKRLYDFHMKDVNAATARGSSVEVGKGVIHVPAVLKALLALNFTGHVALEYEANGDNPQPGVKGSFDYMRSALAKME